MNEIPPTIRNWSISEKFAKIPINKIPCYFYPFSRQLYIFFFVPYAFPDTLSAADFIAEVGGNGSFARKQFEIKN